MDYSIENASRRTFLKAGVGLTLAVYLRPVAAAKAVVGSDAAPAFTPNAFVRVDVDNTVTVVIKHLEMGQGTYTGLSTLVAEEMDADWDQVKAEGAPADAKRYANLLWGSPPRQGTGGSSAIANAFEQMRRAGATARAMLVAAAAEQWSVPAASLTVEKGVVRHPASRRQATFGELAPAAGRQPVPEAVGLKSPEEFVYIGKHVPRKDTADKVAGRAEYTQDVKLPHLLTAVVAHPPRFGARPKRFDPRPALAVKGVVDVVALPNGVAVLGKDFWSAKQGRDALTVEWDESQAFTLGSDEILARYKELAQKPGLAARRDGDAVKALAGAAKQMEAAYELPYLAHAAMEPMDCVVRLAPGSCEVWNGEQFQTGDQHNLAKLLDLRLEQVSITMLYAGGSFGRRANPQSDYLLEAARIAKAHAAKHGGYATVKMVWTREDDMRAGYFRPLFYHVLKGGLDGAGTPVAWQHRIVGQSIMAGSPFEAAAVKNGIDQASVEGAANLPYAIPNLTVDLHSPSLGVPVQWWRAVGSTHTGFTTESFLDELAHAAGQDPYAFRKTLLGGHPRHAGVLNLAAQKAGWGEPLAPGKPGERRGRGIAVHESFRTFVAQVAEVTVQPDGRFKVDRVVCAVDCGVAVNPDVIRAQMEGGIAFGLSAALFGAVTLKDGKVEQSNFDDYPILRMADMPKVEVHIVPSAEPPTGVGEPGTPVIAPAVANAIFAATGVRLRRLPFDTAALKQA